MRALCFRLFFCFRSYAQGKEQKEENIGDIDLLNYDKNAKILVLPSGRIPY